MTSDSPIPPFPKLVQLQAAKQGRTPFRGTALAFDPGETTGYAIFVSDGETFKLQEAGRLGTGTFPHCIAVITKLFAHTDPKHVVMEDYRVYSWKQQDHTWNSLHTPRLIGCIETIAFQRGTSVTKQMAQMPKKFVTDDKLKAWNFHNTNRHARDAIRHGAYYLIFGEQGS